MPAASFVSSSVVTQQIAKHVPFAPLVTGALLFKAMSFCGFG